LSQSKLRIVLANEGITPAGDQPLGLSNDGLGANG
jgi:hypothetical protein